jgi:hypothetical protein
MKNIKKISYAVAVLVVTSATSCKKHLEEFNPHSVTAENLWNTPGGFMTLVNSAYSDLHLFYGTDLWYSAGRFGYGKQIMYFEGLSPTQGQPTKAWQACYRSINLCNAAINRIDKAGFSEEEKKQRLGEVYFLRALYNFHLVEQFGGVILRTKETADGGVDLYPTRNTPEEFYDVIISDLETAKEYLPVSWTTAEYSRATRKSAMGLLARALLTRAYYSTGGDRQAWFTKAKDAALEVINKQGELGVELFKTLNEIGQSVYGSTANRAKNKEALFVLSYDQAVPANNIITYANGNRIFKYALTTYQKRPGFATSVVNEYGVDGEGRLMPTWHFLDLFDETKDARYNTWFQEVWKATTAWPWTTTNYFNDANKIDKDPSVAGKTIRVGDTAIYATKGVWPDGKKRTYISVDRTQLYVNPEPGKGAPFVNSTITTYYYPSYRKFVNQNRTVTGNTDFGDALIMRLSEMYMIAAEAYVQLGDNASAATYVNFIRRRAQLPGQNLEVSAADMNIDFILDERAREFALELQRWYDLKRVFRGQDMVDYVKKWNPDITLMEKYHRLRPIPQIELQALLNAKEFGQNEGYPQPQ